MRSTANLPRALLVGVGLILLLASCGESEGGTLFSSQSEINGFRDFRDGSVKSFGIFVCADGGPVTLESVEATSGDGEIEVLGGLFFSAEDGFVGAVNGFPPDGLDPDAVEDISGAVVTADCAEESPDFRDQVIVGVSRTGPEGGVIEGVTINYEGGSFEVDYTIVLCGDQMEHCEGLEEPTTSTTTAP